MKNRNAEPLFSIIIPVYNSQQTIQRCLHSIADQTYKKIETIIVDRYSSDKTIQIAKQFNVKILRLNSERSLAKNFGAKKSSGKFLIFMDSDMELHPKTVEECIVLCNEKNFDAVMIPEKSVGQSFITRCKSWKKQCVCVRFMMKLHGFSRKKFLCNTGSSLFPYGDFYQYTQNNIPHYSLFSEIVQLVKNYFFAPPISLDDCKELRFSRISLYILVLSHIAKFCYLHCFCYFCVFFDSAESFVFQTIIKKFLVVQIPNTRKQNPINFSTCTSL